MTRDQLDRIFAFERYHFALSFPHASRAVLSYVDGPCTLPGKCAFRDLAYALPTASPPRVVVHTRLLTLPVENVVGLLRHELGHVCDPYPYIPNTGREQIADEIARVVRGDRINYDQNDVQTIGPGKYPRPGYLHQ